MYRRDSISDLPNKKYIYIIIMVFLTGLSSTSDAKDTFEITYQNSKSCFDYTITLMFDGTGFPYVPRINFH